jgi:hypothetical protein
MAYAAGFRPIKRPGMGELAFEYEQMTDGEASALGEALVLTSGKLTKCGATATPQFIAMKTVAAATPGAVIPVIRTDELTEFTTQSMATVASTLIGNKVTLHTDGLLVTATTTSGVFEISETDGATTTSNLRGRFRR